MTDRVSVNHEATFPAIAMPPTLGERASTLAKGACGHVAKSAATFSQFAQASCQRLRKAWNAVRAPTDKRDVKTEHSTSSVVRTQRDLERAFPGFKAEFVGPRDIARNDLISSLEDGTQSSLLVRMKGGSVCYTRDKDGWRAYGIPEDYPVKHPDPVELVKTKFPENRKIRAMNFKLTAKTTELDAAVITDPQAQQEAESLRRVNSDLGFGVHETRQSNAASPNELATQQGTEEYALGVNKGERSEVKTSSERGTKRKLDDEDSNPNARKRINVATTLPSLAA
ncbi:hypothetical protein E4K72_20410 [Oxalobacteraceae bacterium OM1]|nr:hypothetical protein E4K72_20410 [Oxalobacteraceae bacterium OM1]